MRDRYEYVRGSVNQIRRLIHDENEGVEFVDPDYLEIQRHIPEERFGEGVSIFF